MFIPLRRSHVVFKIKSSEFMMPASIHVSFAHQAALEQVGSEKMTLVLDAFLHLRDMYLFYQSCFDGSRFTVCLPRYLLAFRNLNASISFGSLVLSLLIRAPKSFGDCLNHLPKPVEIQSNQHRVAA